MNTKVVQKINEQIKHEFDSAYLYLAMSVYFEEQNLSGMATWMRLQASEEQMHAMKFFDHLKSRGAKIELLALDKPKQNWKSALDAFSEAYKHELKVTALIHNLVTVANKEKDYASNSLLTWFIDEQVEEEENASVIVEKLKMIKDDKPMLMMLDKELGTRTLTPAE